MVYFDNPHRGAVRRSQLQRQVPAEVLRQVALTALQHKVPESLCRWRQQLGEHVNHVPGPHDRRSFDVEDGNELVDL